MRILHARSRFSGPDSHLVIVPVQTDQFLHFKMRYAEPDGTLVPFMPSDGRAVLTIRSASKVSEVVGEYLVDYKLWRFHVKADQITSGATGLVEGNTVGHKKLFSTLVFNYSRTGLY